MKTVPLIVLVFVGLIFIPVIILSNDVHALDIPAIRAELENKAENFHKLSNDFGDFLPSFLRDTKSAEHDICYEMNSKANESYEIASLVIF